MGDTGGRNKSKRQAEWRGQGANRSRSHGQAGANSCELLNAPGANVSKRRRFCRFPEMCWVQVPLSLRFPLHLLPGPRQAPRTARRGAEPLEQPNEYSPQGSSHFFLRQEFCYFHEKKSATLARQEQAPRVLGEKEIGTSTRGT